MTRQRAILVGLLLLSCAPHTSTTTTTRKATTSKAPPFGDAIDDAAWEALGPRPANAKRLPVGAMRLVDFWFVDDDERRLRTMYAIRWTRTADASRTKHSIERLDLYLDAIRVAPLELPAWPQACRVLIDRNEVERAYALARQYARLTEPGDGIPQYILGKCEALRGNPEVALELFEQAAASHTTAQTDVITSMALVHLQLGNLNAADSLRTVYDLRQPALVLLIDARKARQDGNLQRAADLLTQATTTPGVTGVWEELASVHLALDDLDAASRAYRKALEETPDRTSPHIGLASVAKAQGDYDAAERTLLDLLQRDPGNLVAHFNLAGVLLERGRADGAATPAATRDFVRAETSWRLCIEEDFNAQAALWGRAEINLRRHQLSAAQFDAEHLREISDDVAPVHTRWARLLIVCGYESVALQALREAARHKELDRDGRALLAQLEDKAGMDAIPLLREAFRENPQDASVAMRLGIALLNEGELEEAERVMRAVVELRPEDASAFQNLAAVLDRRKKYREAQAAMQKAESLR